MFTITVIIKVIAILAAAILLGNWFQSEVKKSKRNGDPWFTPYLSAPGVLILIIILLLPLAVYFFKH